MEATQKDQFNNYIANFKLFFEQITKPSDNVTAEVDRERVIIFNTFLVLVIIAQSLYLVARLLFGFLSENKVANKDIYLNSFLLLCFICTLIKVWVVSDDYKRENNLTCKPFELVQCDTVITEATFGLPNYRWPKYETEVKIILNLIKKFHGLVFFKKFEKTDLSQNKNKRMK